LRLNPNVPKFLSGSLGEGAGEEFKKAKRKKEREFPRMEVLGPAGCGHEEQGASARTKDPTQGLKSSGSKNGNRREKATAPRGFPLPRWDRNTDVL